MQRESLRDKKRFSSRVLCSNFRRVRMAREDINLWRRVEREFSTREKRHTFFEISFFCVCALSFSFFFVGSQLNFKISTLFFLRKLLYSCWCVLGDFVVHVRGFWVFNYTRFTKKSTETREKLLASSSSSSYSFVVIYI